MKEDDFEKSEDNVEGQLLEQGGLSSTEEGFMKGYLSDDEVKECTECGTTLSDGSVTREVDDEEMIFCSKSCADDYEESL